MILIQEDEGFVTPLKFLSNVTLVYKITKIVLLMKVKIPKQPSKDCIQPLDHVSKIRQLLIVMCFCGMKFVDESLTPIHRISGAFGAGGCLRVWRAKKTDRRASLDVEPSDDVLEIDA